MRFALFFCVLLIFLDIALSLETQKKGLVATKERLEITGNKFVAEDKTKMAIIQGNVQIKKGKDRLFADKVSVFLNEKRRPKRYEAVGDVRFTIFTEDNREIQGSADKLIYNALNGEYRLIKNAVVKEIGKANTIIGDEIILNKTKGYADVVGSENHPAKFIFDIEDINEENRKAKLKQNAKKSKQAQTPTNQKPANKENL
ncbi:lipopolysaccharide transport periplasmic protein LptA [Helicobacter cetorum]|uniref:lipopolysaccharide transport periplasmic protein LptA n=1 Tax=Helicobacter cetorum TaxID=138563 RepID=UPI000CF052D4|nr:lipopolysaccharide transport periplasmic protein LptA [Helicobacter cetorum]